MNCGDRIAARLCIGGPVVEGTFLSSWNEETAALIQVGDERLLVAQTCCWKIAGHREEESALPRQGVKWIIGGIAAFFILAVITG